MIKLAISGCHGRMGQRIINLAFNDDSFQVMALLEHKDHPNVSDPINNISVCIDSVALKGCDALIEFTSPEATLDHLKACVDHKVRMVIGTTGLTEEMVGKIKEASKTIPIVFSSNMSVGVNLVFKLTELVAEKTKQNYSAMITEAHHVHKKDAPSGTAKTIASIYEKAAGKAIMNIDAIREGEIVGDHKIVFESEEDTITIEHHAKTRDIFAKGALVAAKFLMDKEAGLYTMQDVLELN